MTGNKTGKAGRQAIRLDTSITELESLIAARSHFDREDIPILDDVVDPDQYEESAFPEAEPDWLEMDLPEAEDADKGLSSEQIEMLVGSMDQRISGELDELVNILKDAIKDSIMTEIKSQLESSPQDKPADKKDPSDNR